MIFNLRFWCILSIGILQGWTARAAVDLGNGFVLVNENEIIEALQTGETNPDNLFCKILQQHPLRPVGSPTPHTYKITKVQVKREVTANFKAGGYDLSRLNSLPISLHEFFRNPLWPNAKFRAAFSDVGSIDGDGLTGLTIMYLRLFYEDKSDPAYPIRSTIELRF